LGVNSVGVRGLGVAFAGGWCWCRRQGKEADGFASVVYSLHYLRARLLREWVRHAGAHIYAENDNSAWATRASC